MNVGGFAGLPGSVRTALVKRPISAMRLRGLRASPVFHEADALAQWLIDNQVRFAYNAELFR